MSLKAVIFDVDGVLVDSYQAHFLSWQQMLNELEITFTEDEFRATFGRTSQDILNQLYGDQFPATQLIVFDDRKEALYRDIIRHEFPAVDGAVELLDALAEAEIAMAVGSSGPPENVALTLECLGRQTYFGAVVTRSDITRGKPDPQVFLVAAERLGIAPGDCVVIEDAPAGVEAANRAGMSSVALTGTARREQLAQAMLVVDSLRELTPGRLQDLCRK